MTPEEIRAAADRAVAGPKPQQGQLSATTISKSADRAEQYQGMTLEKIAYLHAGFGKMMENANMYDELLFQILRKCVYPEPDTPEKLASDITQGVELINAMSDALLIPGMEVVGRDSLFKKDWGRLREIISSSRLKTALKEKNAVVESMRTSLDDLMLRALTLRAHVGETMRV